MDLALTRHLAGLARTVYLPEPEAALPAGRAYRLDPFATRGFRGLAVSDGHAAYLAFRGTKGGLGEPGERRLAAWATNLDFTQVARDGYRVHRGYGREIEESLDDIERLARLHGAARRPLWLTGHSAGGALAQLAARRLAERGVPVAGAIVFSAPRVGDRAFAASFPVPLWRIESRHDIVPHLPLPPRTAVVLGRLVVDPWLARVAGRAGLTRPLEQRVAGTEYLHAGQLIYDDGHAALFRVPPGQFWRRVGPLLGAELRHDLLRRGEPPPPQVYRTLRCPSFATPVPARVLDTVRFTNTLREVARQLRAGQREFVRDHHMDGAVAFLERLTRPALPHIA